VVILLCSRAMLCSRDRLRRARSVFGEQVLSQPPTVAVAIVDLHHLAIGFELLEHGSLPLSAVAVLPRRRLHFLHRHLTTCQRCQETLLLPLIFWRGHAFIALKEEGVSCAAVLLVRLAPPYPASPG